MKIFKDKKTIFLIFVTIFYIFLFVKNPELGRTSLQDFSDILLKVIPLLGLVFVIMVLVNYFISDELVQNKLGSGSGKSGTVFAVFFGIFISGPAYMLYPLLKSFKEKGATNYTLAIFLYNRNVKIPFIPVMIFYFGIKFTVIISIYIMIFSVFNGFLVEYFSKNEYVE